MLRHRLSRRALGLALVIIGGVLLWSAASPVGGAALFVLAIALEVIGIRLEHQTPRESNALDRR